jgi:hypothetical protein
MRNFSIFVVLVFGVLAAAIGLYWFFEATTLPVANPAEQTIQVLYNIHAAIWTLIALVAFGLAGLLAKPTAGDKPAVRPAGRPAPMENPREHVSGPRGRRARVEPRL